MSTSGSATSSPNLSPVPCAMTPGRLLGRRDQLDGLTPPRRPSLAGRALLRVCLLVVQVTTAVFRMYNWLAERLWRGPCPQKTVYKNLAAMAREQNTEGIRDLLLAQSKQETDMGFLLGELLALPELHGYLLDIMQGAHVCLEDGGALFQIWKEHPHTHPRPSSHEGLGWELGHCLFGCIERKTEHGDQHCSCFQFENSPMWGGITSFFNHCIDYLRYRISGLQQGPVPGGSPIVDRCCFVFAIDMDHYFTERAQLLDPPDAGDLPA